MIGLDKYKAIFLILISCSLYFYIGYFLERSAFNTLFFSWVFFIYLLLFSDEKQAIKF